MKIGIIVYSQTGNTLSAADRLKERFIKSGFDAVIEQIRQADENNKDVNKIAIKNMPQLSTYDILVFASPVQAFSLAAVFKAYLQNIERVDGKRVFCFVTKGIPKNGFGGNKSIKTITKIVSSKGGKAEKTAIIHWKDETVRNKQIDDMLEEFAAAI